MRLTVPDTNGIRGPPFPTGATGTPPFENATPEDLDMLVSDESLVAENDPRTAKPSHRRDARDAQRHLGVA